MHYWTSRIIVEKLGIRREHSEDTTGQHQEDEVVAGGTVKKTAGEKDGRLAVVSFFFFYSFGSLYRLVYLFPIACPVAPRTWLNNLVIDG